MCYCCTALNRPEQNKKGVLMENNEIFGVIQTRIGCLPHGKIYISNDDPSSSNLFVCLAAAAKKCNFFNAK